MRPRLFGARLLRRPFVAPPPGARCLWPGRRVGGGVRLAGETSRRESAFFTAQSRESPCTTGCRRPSAETGGSDGLLLPSHVREGPVPEMSLLGGERSMEGPVSPASNEAQAGLPRQTDKPISLRGSPSGVRGSRPPHFAPRRTRTADLRPPPPLVLLLQRSACETHPLSPPSKPMPSPIIRCGVPTTLRCGEAIASYVPP